MEIIKNEEAQFMLLAGFIIAIGLVITSALLSNIIFQGNMAGEAGADPLKYEIVNLMQITGDEMKSAYRNATALGGSNTQKINNFSKQMQNFNGNLSKIYALRGGGVKVSNDTSNWNSSRYANFTKNGTANGAVNWTVIENVQNVNVFKLTNVNTTGSNFNVYVTNQTTEAFLWSMQVVGSGPKNVSVNYSGCTPASQCPREFTVTDFPTIDLLNEFSSPPAYNFNYNLTGKTFKIQFLNGSDASGTFYINGTASGRNFTRARDYILNATVTLSTSRMRANITIPVSVPW